MDDSNQTPSKQVLMEIYRWSIILFGITAIGFSASQLLRDGISYWYFIYVCCSVLIAPQITVKIPRFNGNLTFSDAFIFAALLLWGSPAAVVLATVDSVVSSTKVKSSSRTYLFNAGVNGLSIWLTASFLTFIFGDLTQLAHDPLIGNYILALCSLGLFHYATNATMVAAMQALKFKQVVWREWSRFYLWMSVTFFLGAAAAGLVVKLLDTLNFLALFIVSPAFLLVYFTYRSYINNLDRLQESEERFRNSFDYANVGMALVSPEGQWIDVNQSLCKTLKYAEADLLNNFYQTSVHPEDIGQVEEKIAQILKGKQPASQSEIRFLRKDKAEVWGILSVSLAKDSNGDIKHLIFQLQDVTSRKEAENKLMYSATHDALTGLLNRTAYSNAITAALERAKRSTDRVMAVLFLDLDGFKLVNDSLGHNAGDELLKEVSFRLLDCVRGSDTVARLGGDEFAILLENLHGLEESQMVAERILRRLIQPFVIEGQEVFIGTSIGIATTLIDYEDHGEMLRDADAAMYQAKARGKGCYVIFDYEMHEEASKLLFLANDLRRAIDRNELFAYYQPIQRLETGQIEGFEALVRWNHPAYGLISPGVFIPLAEENGMINAIDSWILREACRQIKSWQNTGFGHENLSISVNISPKQFAQNTLVDYVKAVLAETGVNPRHLQLEITETAMMKNLKNTAKILEELSLIGINIALDDFGTGYSSLSYLHELPISTLKIDRSFTRRLDDDSEGKEIVRAIVTLAHTLKMDVVAEGIETANHLHQLKKIDCDYGQGYYLSHPISVEEATNLLHKISGNFTVNTDQSDNLLQLVSIN
jgi:diguanylate cyclase (GGDEF)-like protein/PAS domain S-box-containing protein